MNTPRLTQTPTKLPDGRWQARLRFPDESRHTYGIHKTKREAQAVMDAEWERWHALGANPETVGGYAATWTQNHPRSPRTNATNAHRISRVLDVKVEGKALRDWNLRELKRRHIHVLVDAMLRKAA